MLESELFGHERGAFTGAVARRKGRFESAHGGTLFLDEVGDMPLATQAKLLRALESGEVVRVGSNETFRVDVRVIAATNKDLTAAVADGRFREDLYFRLRVVTLELPPLRERLGDLPPLAAHFVALAAERHGKPGRTISAEALDLLTGYRWPGNVRELKNVVEAMVLMSRGAVLGPETVPAYARVPNDRSDPLKSLSGVALGEVERRLVENTLRDVGGNRDRAARLLGISTRDPLPQDQGVPSLARARTRRGRAPAGMTRRGVPARHARHRRTRSGDRRRREGTPWPPPPRTASSASTSGPRTAWSPSWRAVSLG